MTSRTGKAKKAPLLVVGHGLMQIDRCDSLVSHIDLTSSFLDLAGLEIPETVQGVTFLPILHDPTATLRDVVLAEGN